MSIHAIPATVVPPSCTPRAATAGARHVVIRGGVAAEIARHAAADLRVVRAACDRLFVAIHLPHRNGFAPDVRSIDGNPQQTFFGLMPIAILLVMACCRRLKADVKQAALFVVADSGGNSSRACDMASGWWLHERERRRAHVIVLTVRANKVNAGCPVGTRTRRRPAAATVGIW